MKLYSISIFFAAVTGVTEAFAPHHHHSVTAKRHPSSSLMVSSIDRNISTSYSLTESSSTTTINMEEYDIQHAQMSTEEVLEIRNELIQKYLSIGRSQEYAEAEVDEFLRDEKRSAKYFDMKRYARTEGGVMGFETAVQVCAYLLMGHIVSDMMRLFMDYQNLTPSP